MSTSSMPSSCLSAPIVDLDHRVLATSLYPPAKSEHPHEDPNIDLREI
jgi:hypothetical protein